MTGIVTDSTADLPLSYYEKHDVVMVPFRVRFGREELRDWLDIDPSGFYARLGQAQELPKTSQPSPAEFLAAYNELLARHKSIISLHISSKLSGTYASARMAASAKARGLRQAIEVTADKISDAAGLMKQPELICAHAGAPDSLRALRAAMIVRGVPCPDTDLAIGSVVGAYLGPGSFAVAAVDHACF